MTDKLDLVLERTIDAPIDLVWKAYTDAEHLKRWFAPRPYEITEMELDLRPGGIFRLRMQGPDGFDTGHGVPGCVLAVVERKKRAWTSALGPGYRPNEAGEGCDSVPMTESSRSRTPAMARQPTRRWRSTRAKPTARHTRRWASTKAGARSPASSRNMPRV